MTQIRISGWTAASLKTASRSPLGHPYCTSISLPAPLRLGFLLSNTPTSKRHNCRETAQKQHAGALQDEFIFDLPSHILSKDRGTW